MLPLEDAFADIVRKARRGRGISTEALSRSSGLTGPQIEQIETYKLIPPDGAIERLAAELGLHPARLAAIAHDTYHPADPDLERWGCVATITSHYADFTVNAYLVWDPKTRRAVLFDTGTDFDAITRVVDSQGLKVETVALTHTHGDHIEVLERVRQAFHPAILTSKAEPISGAHFVREGDISQLGSLAIETRETDGHSPGGLTYVVTGFAVAPAIAVAGDALFAGSAGGAMVSYERLHANIRSKILSLPDDTLILPGHGPLTTVGQEKANNPFAP